MSAVYNLIHVLLSQVYKESLILDNQVRALYFVFNCLITSLYTLSVKLCVFKERRVVPTVGKHRHTVLNSCMEVTLNLTVSPSEKMSMFCLKP